MNDESTAKPPRPAVELGVEDQAWRKVSPVSPLLNTWSAIVVVIAALVFQNLDNLRDPIWLELLGTRGIGFILLVLLGGFLALLTVVSLYCWLGWRATSYAVTEQAVWYRSGIIFRNQRHARLERIQAVDLVFPLLGRIFGLGKISIEVAGSSGSSLSFGYLKRSQLDELRAEVLARAAGVEVDSASPVEPGQAPVAALALAAPERELYWVKPGQLIASLLLNLGILGALAATVLFLASLISTYIFIDSNLWGLLVALPGVLGIASIVWGRFASEFNFRAAVSPDGIRVRRGLLETRAQTIPPRRVHAIQISQPFLWRKLGWYRVTIDQAGYGGGGESASSSSDVLLPVGDRTQAMLALWLVLPDLGAEDPEGFVQAALVGEGPEQGFTQNPAQSKLFDPLVYRRRAMAITDTCMVVRDGRISRSVKFVPFERIQSLALEQGPWARRRSLASLHAHTVPGPVAVRLENGDCAQMRHMLQVVAARATEKRESEPPERWMQRVAPDLIEPDDIEAIDVDSALSEKEAFDE